MSRTARPQHDVTCTCWAHAARKWLQAPNVKILEVILGALNRLRYRWSASYYYYCRCPVYWCRMAGSLFPTKCSVSCYSMCPLSLWISRVIGLQVHKKGFPLITRSLRSTIEVAHFRYFVSETRGSSTRDRRNANLVSVNKWRYCILGPWDYSPRCNLVFAEVSFWVRYGAPKVRSLSKFRVNLYHRTPPCACYCNHPFVIVIVYFLWRAVDIGEAFFFIFFNSRKCLSSGFSPIIFRSSMSN